MLKTKRIVAIILLVSILFRFCFVLIHLNHECTHDDDCSICTLINSFKKDISTIKPGILVLIIPIFFFSILLIYFREQIIDKKKYSPIGLKVELIN